jgi:hypothetical protein
VVSFTTWPLYPGEKAGLDAVAKRKKYLPCRESNPCRQARSKITIRAELCQFFFYGVTTVNIQASLTSAEDISNLGTRNHYAQMNTSGVLRCFQLVESMELITKDHGICQCSVIQTSISNNSCCLYRLHIVLVQKTIVYSSLNAAKT